MRPPSDDELDEAASLVRARLEHLLGSIPQFDPSWMLSLDPEAIKAQNRRWHREHKVSVGSRQESGKGRSRLGGSLPTEHIYRRFGRMT